MENELEEAQAAPEVSDSFLMNITPNERKGKKSITKKKTPSTLQGMFCWSIGKSWNNNPGRVLLPIGTHRPPSSRKGGKMNQVTDSLQAVT